MSDKDLKRFIILNEGIATIFNYKSPEIYDSENLKNFKKYYSYKFFEKNNRKFIEIILKDTKDNVLNMFKNIRYELLSENDLQNLNYRYSSMTRSSEKFLDSSEIEKLTTILETPENILETIMFYTKRGPRKVKDLDYYISHHASDIAKHTYHLSNYETDSFGDYLSNSNDKRLLSTVVNERIKELKENIYTVFVKTKRSERLSRSIMTYLSLVSYKKQLIGTEDWKRNMNSF